MLTFNYTDNGYEVTGQVEPLETDIIIPSTFDDGTNGEFPVVSIGNYAFLNNQLTSVTIPDSVTSIEDRAFINNQLTSVEIPDSVTSIGQRAFSGNPIENISVSAANANFKSDDNVLFSKGGETLILSAQKNSYTIPTGVTNIGEYAFYNNQLTSVTIPSSVISIGEYAFAGNQLTSVTIPNSVTNIGDRAFNNNQLTSITIPDSVTSIGSTAFSSNQLTSVVWETSSEIPSYTFAGSNHKITSFTITSDVLIALANINAFVGVTVEQPMTVYVQPQLIEDYKTATNWATLYNDGRCDFVDIALASAITKLKPYLTAIKEAIQFKDGSTGNVNVQDMPQMIRDLPSGGGGLEFLMRIGTIPDDSKAILTQEGDGTLHAEIPNNVTQIGGYSFAYHQLTSVTIPYGVTNIGDSVFRDNQLTNITIPNNVTHIGVNAFASNQLTSVTIPNGVTDIGIGAFQNNQLASVVIPNSVTTIGLVAFESNQLTSVVWETSANIPTLAFGGQYNLITSFIITSDTVISLEDINAFDVVITVEQPMTVYVQPQLIEDYKTATNWTALFNAGRCDFVDIALAPTE